MTKIITTEPTTRTGTQLLDLPNELLSQIALCYYSVSRHGFDSCLSIDRTLAKTKFNINQYRESRLSLANLCLTSHRLKAICQLILYEEFVPNLRPAADNEYRYSVTSLPYLDTMRPTYVDLRLIQFINTILRRRDLDLASRVKRVHISADILVDTPEHEAWSTVELASELLAFPLNEFLKHWNAEHLLTRNTSSPVVKGGPQRCTQITGSMIVAILVGALPRLHHLSIQTGWLEKRQVPPDAIHMVCGGMAKESIPLRVLDVSNFWTGYIYQHIHPHKWARITAQKDARFDESVEDMVARKSLEDWGVVENEDLETGRNDLLCRIGV
ncbi:hypothetical protein QBC43DRAFT_63828 [Cladorrhinum sp. PSN259]|nr:hypothetical protein QBC43DRAFT_63828 [Cladorrhinum sp. PSN259]